MKKDSLGDRMKANYENRYRIKLTRRMPIILRLDGKAFHTLTRSCDKPFDDFFQTTMINTAFTLCTEVQGVKCAYAQSDEISLLVTDFDKLSTDAWFDYNLQKMVSVSAGIASANFTKDYGKIGIFDCRAFNIPKEEVCNYFVWRQKDWIRNSVSMLAQAHYSHKELHKKNQADMHEMLHEKGINWANVAPQFKNGGFLSKYNTESWFVNYEAVFTKHRNLIEDLLIPEEE